MDGNGCTSTEQDEQLMVLLRMGFELEAAQAALMICDSIENAVDHLVASCPTEPPAPPCEVPDHSDGIIMSSNDAEEFRKSLANGQKERTSSESSRKGKGVDRERRLQPPSKKRLGSLSAKVDHANSIPSSVLKRQKQQDHAEVSAASVYSPAQVLESERCPGSETSSITAGGGCKTAQLLMACGDQAPARSGPDGAGMDWKERAQEALKKHFGHQVLKPFQQDALEGWAAHQDCFVLSATGSGKSLCFQLPALITGKVVVVISPLISLMHDQCMQLSQRGISSCFLGSGQPDPVVERAALSGAYSLVYLCPETLTRLVSGLQELARCRGIALFAIDEAHCISKWGHDFRPDYRKLSLLRTKFKANSCKQVPIMALTATATCRVREDILRSLCFEQENSRIVLTTLFRPNLRCSVKHSKTTKSSSYARDFADLIHHYTKERTTDQHNGSSLCGTMEVEQCLDEMGEDENVNETELDEQYLEDDESEERMAADFDVTYGQSNLPRLEEARTTSERGATCSDQGTRDGPSIVYMPTRKETVRLATYLRQRGVLAKPYNAKLPRSHLRQVHEEFQAGDLQVVVATIAFGMGINKPNIRRIIHYGWPQNLEAYYQEAGRAGRDGLASDCKLFCDMTVLPSLLPSRKDAHQTRHALDMLTQCYLYGIATSSCRVKMLLKYFDEELGAGECSMCDICEGGSPPVEDLTAEAALLLGVLDAREGDIEFKVAVDKVIAESALKGLPKRDRLWWRGFGRVLENLGYLQECQGKDKTMRSKVTVGTLGTVEPSEQGLKFLSNCGDHAGGGHQVPNGRENVGIFPPLLVHPEGDMLQAMTECAEVTPRTAAWGRGWADPVVRAQRLAASGRARKGKRRKKQAGSKWKAGTVRGRLAAKLSK